MAVAAHEIPQEIGDFGLLISKGLSRTKVLLVNIFSALATTVAAIIFFQLGQGVDIRLDIVLGLVAGFFIYIAASDIFPTIQHQKLNKLATTQALIVILGALTVSMVTTVLHQYIDQGQNHDHTSEDHDHADHDELNDDHSDEHHDDDEHSDEQHSDHEI